MANDSHWTEEEREAVADALEALAQRRGETAPSPPARYKNRDELDPGEELEYRKSGQLPESPEYVEAKHKALTAAGLESDEASASEAAEPSTADYLAQIQERGGRP
jgi:hypothetical protein